MFACCGSFYRGTPHVPTLIALFAVLVAWPQAGGADDVAEAVQLVRSRSNSSDISQTLPRLSTRFASADASEAIDFQRHVVPLMGRLGCNGRACHGSFQGRGGFALSLFGYDFAGDHKALMEEHTGRVDLDEIDESLILAKPIDADMHEGGKRMDRDSWQYRVLRQWVAQKAPFDASQIESIAKLEVSPSTLVFDAASKTQSLTAIAHWSDGTKEDVTDLCRFSSNDDAIAAIDENGRVTSGVRGATHVVVSYDNAVVPVPVIRPVVVAEPLSAPPVSGHAIDQIVVDHLNGLGITPSTLCSDSEFIRRASLDITGTLPSPEDVRRFVADDAANKREEWVDQMLDSPGYAAWWATRLSDWTGNSAAQLNNALPIRNAASRLWYHWLRVRLEDNVPYDEIVEGMVSAASRDGDESYTEYCENMTLACKPGGEEAFAQRDGMPLYWARRNFAKPEDRAIGFAYTFLGIRIECAQCHKHPFDRWSKNDFEEFAKLFEGISARSNDVAPDSTQERDALLKKITGGKKLRGGDLRRKIYDAARDGKTVPFPELVFKNRAYQAKRQQQRKKGADPTPPPMGQILGESELTRLDQDPRNDLMAWLRDPTNPYFARAIVNRVWANYFGIGIVSPTDDMNLANPPSNAALLDHLTETFIVSGYDLKELSRSIVLTDTYQRSTEPNESNVDDRVHFSRHVPRRLPAEVIHDAVLLATESSSTAQKVRDEFQGMAIAGTSSSNRNNSSRFALEVFGQSIRESNCDCDRSDEPSLLQSIYLRNDFDIYRQLSDKNSWVTQACSTLGYDRNTDIETQRVTAEIKRLDAVRKQMVGRIERFKQLPESAQLRQRQRIQSDYQRMVKRFAPLDIRVPSLRKLLADPQGWTIEPPEPKQSAQDEIRDLASVVEDAYLRTLSRFPDEDELEISVGYIQDSEDKATGLESLMWALVNTKEFIITH